MNNQNPRKTNIQPICVGQLNTQKKKDAATQLLNQHVQDFNIIILQEPAWGFISSNDGREIRGPVMLQGWNPIIPTTTGNNPTTKPCTLTYYCMRPDFSITLRSDIIED